jgi:Protein of unknown function (DUF1573)
VIALSTFVTAIMESVRMYDDYNPNHATLPNIVVNEPKTTIKFDELVHDFGSITTGDIVKHTFYFTNSGTNPLLITNATASCGCTVPIFPKTPVAPGARDSVIVQFNSANKLGLQNKTVNVYANTNPASTVLGITASVKEKE